MWTISTIYDFIVGTLSRLLLAGNFDIKGDVSLVTFSGWGLISAILKISTSGFLQTSSFVIVQLILPALLLSTRVRVLAHNLREGGFLFATLNTHV